MTDREKQNSQQPDSSEAESADYVEESRAKRSASDADADDDSISDSPITIEEEVQLSIGSSEEELADSRSPTPAVQAVTPQSTKADLSISSSRDPEQLETNFRPRPAVSSHESEITSYQIEVKRVSEAAEGEIRPQQNRETRRDLRHLSSRTITVTRQAETVTDETRPSTTLSQVRVQGGQTLLDNVEEIDPIFGWRGGHPYGSNRPVLIFHQEKEGIPSFEFLQRCLRDTYAELEGGEPTSEQIDFVANDAQVPAVGGRIITLDLTDDWSTSLSGDRPTIEKGGIDIVPTLVEIAHTLYSGGLGYVAINVPSEWAEDKFLRSEFMSNLVEYVADAAPHDPDDEGETGTLEKIQTAPVTIAQPRITDKESFEARVAQYFGFDRVPSWETIAQADAAFTNLLRSERWAQVALTERQSHNEESSRHYNWKGLLVDGIARQFWIAATDGEEPFNTFAQQKLHRQEDGPLFTEYPIDGDIEDASAIADIYLKGDTDWFSEGIESFLPDVEYLNPVTIEFETGFTEGAFQHRKLVETVEKYDNTSFSGTVLLVVPPRLLYRGKQQARLITQLIGSENEQFDDFMAVVGIPVISNSTCTGIRKATRVTKELYDNE